MANRALVTGAYGFAGTALCNRLEADGWSVVRCGLAPTRIDEANLSLDIRHADACANVMRDAGDVTHIFHLAAVAHAGAAHRDPAATFEVNAVGTINLATAALAHKPEARFLQIGSAAEYGLPQYLPIDEAHPLDPGAPYGISKVAAERYCAFLHNTQDFDAVLLRPFNHTGPGQTEDYVLPAFARQLAEIEAGLSPPILRVGNLDVHRDFLHVDDVIDAYLQAATRATSGAAYNICSGKTISIRDALESMIKAMDIDVSIEIDPARVRKVDAPEIYGSHDRLTADTGWEPTTPIHDLLLGLIADWRERTRNA